MPIFRRRPFPRAPILSLLSPAFFFLLVATHASGEQLPVSTFGQFLKPYLPHLRDTISILCGAEREIGSDFNKGSVGETERPKSECSDGSDGFGGVLSALERSAGQVPVVREWQYPRLGLESMLLEIKIEKVTDGTCDKGVVPGVSWACTGIDWSTGFLPGTPLPLFPVENNIKSDDDGALPSPTAGPTAVIRGISRHLNRSLVPFSPWHMLGIEVDVDNSRNSTNGGNNDNNNGLTCSSESGHPDDDEIANIDEESSEYPRVPAPIPAVLPNIFLSIDPLWRRRKDYVRAGHRWSWALAEEYSLAMAGYGFTCPKIILNYLLTLGRQGKESMSESQQGSYFVGRARDASGYGRFNRSLHLSSSAQMFCCDGSSATESVQNGGGGIGISWRAEMFLRTVCPCPWQVPVDHGSISMRMAKTLADVEASGFNIAQVGIWTGRPGFIMKNGIALVGRVAGGSNQCRRPEGSPSSTPGIADLCLSDISYAMVSGGIPARLAASVVRHPALVQLVRALIDYNKNNNNKKGAKTTSKKHRKKNRSLLHAAKFARGGRRGKYSGDHSEHPPMGAGACEDARQLKLILAVGRGVNGKKNNGKKMGAAAAMEVIASESEVLRLTLKTLRGNGLFSPAMAAAVWRASRRWVAGTEGSLHERKISHLKLAFLPSGGVAVKLYVTATTFYSKSEGGVISKGTSWLY